MGFRSMPNYTAGSMKGGGPQPNRTGQLDPVDVTLAIKRALSPQVQRCIRTEESNRMQIRQLTSNGFLEANFFCCRVKCLTSWTQFPLYLPIAQKRPNQQRENERTSSSHTAMAQHRETAPR